MSIGLLHLRAAKALGTSPAQTVITAAMDDYQFESIANLLTPYLPEKMYGQGYLHLMSYLLPLFNWPGMGFLFNPTELATTAFQVYTQAVGERDPLRVREVLSVEDRTYLAPASAALAALQFRESPKRHWPKLRDLERAEREMVALVAQATHTPFVLTPGRDVEFAAGFFLPTNLWEKFDRTELTSTLPVMVYIQEDTEQESLSLQQQRRTGVCAAPMTAHRGLTLKVLDADWAEQRAFVASCSGPGLHFFLIVAGRRVCCRWRLNTFDAMCKATLRPPQALSVLSYTLLPLAGEGLPLAIQAAIEAVLETSLGKPDEDFHLITVNGRVEVTGQQLGRRVFEYSLLDHITNDPRFSAELFVEDNNQPQARKQEVGVHYGLTDESQAKFVINRRDDGLVVRFTDCQSQLVVDRAIRLALALCVAALDLPTYPLQARVLVFASGTLRQVTVPREAPGAELAALRVKLPAVYDGPVTCKAFPVVVDAAEELPEDYTEHNVPGIDARLACGPDNPSLTLVKSKVKGAVPGYFPCCQLLPPDLTIEEMVTKYQRIRKQAATEKIAEGGQVLKPGRTGRVLGQPLVLLLQARSKTEGRDVEGEFLRTLPDASQSSLFHAVLTAVGDLAYLAAADRDAHVLGLRAALPARVLIGCLRQEMPFHTKAVIDDLLANPRSVLDSRLVYRAFEELYDINIYVLTEAGNFELPAYWRVPIKTYGRKRRSLLLIRRDVQRKQPIPSQYEILHLPGSWLQTDDTEYIHELFMFNHQVRLHEGPQGFVADDGKLFDAYSLFNVAEMVRGRAITQHLDTLGKLRGVDIQTPGGRLTILTPPGQPLNLPVTQEIHSLGLDDVLRLVPLDRVVSQDARMQGKKRTTMGLWVRAVGLTEGVYFPLKPAVHARLKDVPLGAGQPLPNPGARTCTRPDCTRPDCALDQGSDTWRMRDELLHSIRWVVDLRRLKGSKTPDEVFDSIYRRGDAVPGAVLTERIYELPDLQTSTEALKYLKGVSPYFVSGRLSFNSPVLEAKLRAYVRRYCLVHPRGYRSSLLMTPTVHTASNTHQQPGVTVFYNANDWKLFLSTLDDLEPKKC